MKEWFIKSFGSQYILYMIIEPLIFAIVIEHIL